MTDVYISIIVYKGSPLDYSHYRHTALWLRFADRSSPPLIAHIVGPKMDFEFETKENREPQESQRFARRVDVGYLKVAATSEQVVRALKRVPIDNRDREFDCQKWVEDALRRFKSAGQLSNEAYETGLDGMVDAIAEAGDEEQ